MTLTNVDKKKVKTKKIEFFIDKSQLLNGKIVFFVVRCLYEL